LATGIGTELKILTKEQGMVLTAVVNRLIPESNGMPAAGDVNMTGYIDDVLEDAPHLRQSILGLLSELPDMRRLTRMPKEELDSLLTRIQSEGPAKFEALLQVTYTGYYSHPTVLAKLRRTPVSDARPEIFDSRLLGGVRAHGPSSREV
jgi:hypothetical protein